MQDSDSVVECVYNEVTNAYQVRMSWNERHGNALLNNVRTIYLFIQKFSKVVKR
jgi:hypothetical protein